MVKRYMKGVESASSNLAYGYLYHKPSYYNVIAGFVLAMRKLA